MWPSLCLVSVVAISGCALDLTPGTQPTAQSTAPQSDVSPADTPLAAAAVPTPDSPSIAATVPKPNTPPQAEDIAASTRPGDSVMITLQGNDEDGDDLTYTVLSEPASGTLSGSAPFLTYTPRTGFSGATDTFTYMVNDGQADSSPAAVSILVESVKWVRDGETIVNNTDPKAPLEYYGGGSTPGYFEEERFTGMFTVYRLSETLIAVDDRWVDREWEAHNVTIESTFDAPPATLMPGDVVTLTMTFSSNGTVTDGNPGATFQYGADRSHGTTIQPADALAYFPWSPTFDGTASKSWTLTVPQGQPSDTFQVWAGWWNCAVCNVTWTYRAE
jgi:hypothetical protein